LSQTKLSTFGANLFLKKAPAALSFRILGIFSKKKPAEKGFHLFENIPGEVGLRSKPAGGRAPLMLPEGLERLVPKALRWVQMHKAPARAGALVFFLQEDQASAGVSVTSRPVS
jgi:hypothetical protein